MCLPVFKVLNLVLVNSCEFILHKTPTGASHPPLLSLCQSLELLTSLFPHQTTFSNPSHHSRLHGYPRQIGISSWNLQQLHSKRFPSSPEGCGISVMHSLASSKEICRGWWLQRKPRKQFIPLVSAITPCAAEGTHWHWKVIRCFRFLNHIIYCRLNKYLTRKEKNEWMDK